MRRLAFFEDGIVDRRVGLIDTDFGTIPKRGSRRFPTRIIAKKVQ